MGKITILYILRNKTAKFICKSTDEQKVHFDKKKGINVSYNAEDILTVRLPILNLRPTKKVLIIREGNRKAETLRTEGEILGPLTTGEYAGLIKTLMAESLAKVKQMKDWQIAVIIILLCVAIGIGLANLMGYTLTLPQTTPTPTPPTISPP